MELLLLSGDDIRRALPMPAAIDAVETAFVAQAEGRVRAPQRTVLPVDGRGTNLVMPAHLPGTGLVAKVVSAFPGNAARDLPTVTGLLLVLDEETGLPRALVDGAALTSWRTGAAGGAAARLLAPDGAREAALLGAGVQARTQLLALEATIDLARVRVWSRTEARAAKLVEELGGELRAELEVVSAAEEALEGVRVVVCATAATEPLFAADRLPDGAHLTSVGSFTPEMVEVDPALASRARVFVDDREAAEAESGELRAAIAAGHTAPAAWTPLGDALRGAADGRRTTEERTWFKSVGLAAQDATVAAAVVAAARDLGLGRLIEW